MNHSGIQTHQSFPFEKGSGAAAQFSRMFSYVDVCLAYNVLDPVDPWPEFSIFEYGHRVVRRCQDRGMQVSTVGMWGTNEHRRPSSPYIVTQI